MVRSQEEFCSETLRCIAAAGFQTLGAAVVAFVSRHKLLALRKGTPSSTSSRAGSPRPLRRGLWPKETQRRKMCKGEMQGFAGSRFGPVRGGAAFWLARQGRKLQ